jgi:hypothetical protein
LAAFAFRRLLLFGAIALHGLLALFLRLVLEGADPARARQVQAPAV